MVIIGVIAEILIDEFWEVSHPPLLRSVKATTLLKSKSTRFKRYAMLFAGIILVGGGISLESWQGRKADDDADTIRIALQKELIDVSPRPGLLYGKHRQALINRLSGFSGQKVEVRYCWHRPVNTEEWSTAELIQVALRGAKWDVPPFAREDRCGGEGIALYLDPRASERSHEAAETLRAALSEVPLHVDADIRDFAKSRVPAPSDVNTVVVIVYDHPLFVEGIE